MKTTQNIISKTLDPFSKRFLTGRSVRALVAAFATFLAVLCTTPHSAAQKYPDFQFMSCVPDMTIQLLTAPLTTAQRQALHAQNFNNLPVFARPAYLHSVAYAVGCTVASNGQLPTSPVLVNHLQNVIMTGIYEVPAVPQELSQSLAAFLPVVHTTLQELNLLISTQVANNTNFQQAMYAGAVHSFWPGEIGWPW